MSHSSYWTWPRITLAVSARILLVALLFSLMAFAMGLFLGIVALSLNSAVAGQADLANAYRHFGLPGAFIGMFVGIVGMLALELRQFRRPRTPFGG